MLSDFTVESMENLDTIELSLMALEQDPEDISTINAIFRPFHTIKGVSGFLNLQTINRLAHSTENLLDRPAKVISSSTTRSSTSSSNPSTPSRSLSATSRTTSAATRPTWRGVSMWIP
ncbi:MAG: Hpt domain-containing protein [Desulfobacterales bacterium]|nr:Hpt domain-containing protein [Desulfobacterales bacterium]